MISDIRDRKLYYYNRQCLIFIRAFYHKSMQKCRVFCTQIQLAQIQHVLCSVCIARDPRTLQVCKKYEL